MSTCSECERTIEFRWGSSVTISKTLRREKLSKSRRRRASPGVAWRRVGTNNTIGKLSRPQAIKMNGKIEKIKINSFE